MSIELSSAILLINLIAEGVGASKEIIDIAKRIKAGEEITDVEIDQARGDINDAIDDFKRPAVLAL